MKTVEEWAQELPEDVREKFLTNVVRVHGENGLKLKESSLSSAILGLFTWYKSPEDDDYWYNIHKQVKSENR